MWLVTVAACRVGKQVGAGETSRSSGSARQPTEWHLRSSMSLMRCLRFPAIWCWRGRDSQEIAMRQAFGSPLDPWPQGAHRRRGTPLEDDVGSLHKEGAQVLVAALGDPAELGAIPGRILLRDEAKPGGEVASLLEAAAGPDGCHDGARDDRADTRHGHKALAGRIVVGEALDLGCEDFEAPRPSPV